MSDPEPEVKNAAITSLSQSLKNLSVEKICNLILPKLEQSYADSQTSFKAGVALALCEMAGLVGKDFTIQKIITILIELMKDDNAEVRLNVVQNLIKVAEVVHVDLMTPSFVQILGNITKDAQWRVRMAVIELVGDMAIKFGKDTFFKHLEPIFMQYLTNTAAAVREMGIRKVQKMAEQFTGTWVTTFFVPKIADCYNTEKIGFNYRMACLQSLASVIASVDKVDTNNKIVPIFVMACKDPVPNVRFCVCRILKEKKEHISPENWATSFEGLLTQMVKEDTDRDVQYYAQVALHH